MFEIIATVFGLIQGLLIMLKRKENWIFYIANVVALGIFSVQENLWGDVLENTAYALVGCFGLILWYFPQAIPAQWGTKFSKIKYCNGIERGIYLGVAVALFVPMYVWLRQTLDPQPLLDAVTTSIGILATALMLFKKTDAWILWFISDILMAVVYFRLPDRAVYLMTLNVVWTFMAVGTLITWHKESAANEYKI